MPSEDYMDRDERDERDDIIDLYCSIYSSRGVMPVVCKA